MVARPGPNDDVRVWVLAQDPLARGGVAALVASEPGFRVTALGLEAAPDQPPHVVAWDVGPDLAPLSTWDGPPVVALVADEAAAGAALRAGASGLLRRDAEGYQLGAALRAAAAGLVSLDPSFARALARPAAIPTEALTPRELEVLQLLAEGLPNKLVADRLAISEHTAKFHVNAVIAKLGADSRTEAVVKGIRAGWVVL